MATNNTTLPSDDGREILRIPRASSLKGEVNLPGSKSIANRALYLAALSRGTTLLHNLPGSDDVQILLGTLPGLGVEVSQKDGGVEIRGCGGPFPVSEASVNLENAGTALRPMVALLSASHGRFVVDGNEHMRKRPIRDLVDALVELGVGITCSPTGTPPVRIVSEGITGKLCRVSGEVSSQFLTALLVTAPLLDHELTVEIVGDLVSKPYVEITLRMMEQFGAEVRRDNFERFVIPARSAYVSPGEYFIEGDASAATYFLGGGALPGGGPVSVHGLPEDSMQGDVGFVNLLVRMGARVKFQGRTTTVEGPPGTERLKALDVDMNDMPDAAMTMAVLALFADGTTHIRNIANLRVKESERIRGIRAELEKLGAHVEEEHDALHITPPARVRAARIETYHDHRMAMAFSLASFATDLEIVDPACVSKTYPGYFEDFLPLRH